MTVRDVYIFQDLGPVEPELDCDEPEAEVVRPESNDRPEAVVLDDSR